ncbi:uncharacterized protein BDZ99DRAFT_575396 [Mytilinidion resinicola]|uniref:Uncharacterized protein n=1 Tax=Mytilinidion resinicola TaxID=574789 RepID=A0A6A6Y8V7_9PEZI|nr:uncharacterized protein BDZ99DRAFT_575396 [Mytilinidion resinicola]KAF2804394.1 hypothetical protein BDZ99DRAFT_575396 [Mytilinidion resinicola]
MHVSARYLAAAAFIASCVSSPLFALHFPAVGMGNFVSSLGARQYWCFSSDDSSFIQRPPIPSTNAQASVRNHHSNELQYLPESERTCTLLYRACARASETHFHMDPKDNYWDTFWTSFWDELRATGWSEEDGTRMEIESVVAYHAKDSIKLKNSLDSYALKVLEIAFKRALRPRSLHDSSSTPPAHPRLPLDSMVNETFPELDNLQKGVSAYAYISTLQCPSEKRDDEIFYAMMSTDWFEAILETKRKKYTRPIYRKSEIYRGLQEQQRAW